MMQRIPPIVWLSCAVLLVLAVFRLPYGYYSVLRIVICGAATLVAIAGFREETQSAMAWNVIFVLIAVLFNPALPIRLHRSMWFYLDLVAAAVFLAHLFFCRNTSRQGA